MAMIVVFFIDKKSSYLRIIACMSFSFTFKIYSFFICYLTTLGATLLSKLDFSDSNWLYVGTKKKLLPKNLKITNGLLLIHMFHIWLKLFIWTLTKSNLYILKSSFNSRILIWADVAERSLHQHAPKDPKFFQDHHHNSYISLLKNKLMNSTSFWNVSKLRCGWHPATNISLRSKWSTY